MNIINYYRKFTKNFTKKKKKIFLAVSFVFLNCLAWKKVQAYEKSFSSQQQNNNSQEFSDKICQKIKGAPKKTLIGWTYSTSSFSKILKTQIKNKGYFKKKKVSWNNRKILKKPTTIFPFLLEKINENEKINSQKNQINLVDLRIDGMRMINLKKKTEKGKEKYFVEQKNFGILQLLNKSSFYNPDFQASHSLFFSFPETKKMIEFQTCVLSDKLRGSLLQNFSSISGSTFSKNLLVNKISFDFKEGRINLKNFNFLERKKAIIFRKKKFRLKKKFSQTGDKYFHNSLLSNKNQNLRSGLKEKRKNKKKFINKKAVSFGKKFSIDKKLIKKKQVLVLKKFMIISKKNSFFSITPIKKFSRLKNKEKKIRKNIIRSSGPFNHKTTFTTSKIKNYIKFLSIVKKEKKKILKKKKKFTDNNILKFQNKKILELANKRKSFPFRNNSFLCFKKKFICQKILNQKKNLNLNLNKIEIYKNSKRILKIKAFFTLTSRNEKILSSKNFSRFKNKIRYSNIIHSKESCFLLENKGTIHLANSFSKGKIIPRSFYEALVHFFKASKVGNSEALLRMGNLFFEGKGVGRNKKYSIAFFRGSGKRGNKKGLFNTAFMEKRGIGIKHDSLKALHSIKKLEVIGRRKKKRAKNSIKSQKSKYAKSFYRFLQKPNENGLLRCYVNSLISYRSFFFPAVILKKAEYIGPLVNILNRSSILSSYDSTWNLSEIFLENRQSFLASKKIYELYDFYPKEKTSYFFLGIKKQKQIATKLLLLGDSNLNNNKKLHSHFLKVYSFFGNGFLSGFSFLFFFFLSPSFDYIYFSTFFLSLLISPFFE